MYLLLQINSSYADVAVNIYYYYLFLYGIKKYILVSL